MSSPLAPLLQLASPSLPIGGFAYSRGLETAVERGWVTDLASTGAWARGHLQETLTRLDGPLLLRLLDAFVRGDRASAERWARWARACRETSELARESEAMGGALARWAVDLGLASPDDVRAPIRDAHVAVYALAAHRLGLDAGDALRAFLWSSCEATVAAAVKLVPLGQTDGQRLLLALGAQLERAVETVRGVEDEDLGALTFGLAIASAWHETQHTRLFRS